MTLNLESANELIRGVLGKDYLELKVNKVIIDDDTQGKCKVYLYINGSELTGDGIGFVDAMFDAIKKHYAKKYESLTTIQLNDFKIVLTGKKSNHTVSKTEGTDAFCVAYLTLKNHYGTSFNFQASSCSLATAAARSIAGGSEYFINAERAYVALQRALEDAKGRNRQDLVRRYTLGLSEVVKSTSYTQVLNKIPRES